MDLKTIHLACALASLVLILTNCSNLKSQVVASNNSPSNGPASTSPPVTNPPSTSSSANACSFNSLTLQDGQSVSGYLSGNAVSMNTTCTAISSPRTCSNGTLLGNSSYQYEHCVDATACKAPRHYVYTFNADVPLSCVNSAAANAGFLPLVQVSVPDTGRAVARATLQFRNGGTITSFWAAYALVGSATIPGQVGDDICPGATTIAKTVIGSGTLSAGEQTVQVYAAQGADSCTNGLVSAIAGGTVDVWVEDPSTECQGQDIGVVDNVNYFVWPTAAVSVASLPIPATTNRTQLSVISSAEGSPVNDPNKVCGAEAATLVAQVVAGSNVDSVAGVITASAGMGHLDLAPQLVDVPYSPSTTTAILNVGSNFSSSIVFSGGTESGGSILAFIKH